MSLNYDLNDAGHICLAGSVTFANNLFVHPICTAKNRLMAGVAPLPSAAAVRGFAALASHYRGFTAVTVSESVNNSIAYIANSYMQRVSSNAILTSTVAGLIATPIITLGEGMMIKKQLRNDNFKNQLGNVDFWRSIKKTMRLSGLAATALRDIPFTVALLGVENRENKSSDLCRQLFSGFLVGAIAGVLTTPCDSVKTMVQANDEETLRGAGRRYIDQTRSKGGAVRLVQTAAYRTLYIGLSIALMRMFNNKFAELLPEQLQKRNFS